MKLRWVIPVLLLILISGVWLWWRLTNYGFIVIKLERADATIQVDNSAAAANTKLRLEAGTHFIQVEAPNHKPFKQSLELKRGQVTEVNVELTPMSPEDAFSQATDTDPATFTIAKAKYFDNNQWLAGTLAYAEDTGVTGTPVVLRMINGKWVLIHDGIFIEKIQGAVPDEIFTYLQTL